MTLSLATAEALVHAALREARRRSARPLGVVVVDTGGHIVAAAREDGAAFLRIDIATAKAAAVVGMGGDTRGLAERATANPVFFNSLAALANGRVAFSPGGLPIRDAAGVMIGAIGISGDTADTDEACSIAALSHHSEDPSS